MALSNLRIKLSFCSYFKVKICRKYQVNQANSRYFLKALEYFPHFSTKDFTRFPRNKISVTYRITEEFIVKSRLTILYYFPVNYSEMCQVLLARLNATF